MSKQQALIPDVLQEIDFYEDTLTMARIGKQAYEVLRPMAGYLGLDWSAQYRRLMRDEVLARHTSHIIITGADQRRREMVCLEVEYLTGWLFGITPNRAKPVLMSKLRQYRERCFHVLWQAF